MNRNASTPHIGRFEDTGTVATSEGFESLADLLNAVVQWLDAPHAYPLNDAHRRALLAALSEFDGIAAEDAQASADEPLLVVALLGGSGVGKSTLFNALAGGPVAAVSERRPTTTEPVAYVHADVPEDRLYAYGPLRRMRVERHHRPGLRNKIIIDSPDFDTREAVQSHRQTILDLIPYCDLLLFVASPDKYADRAGWELLLQQAPRHAVAFVLTKFDTIDPTQGQSPEADWLRLVAELGYPEPQLFRVRAAEWFEARARRGRLKSGGNGSLAEGHASEGDMIPLAPRDDDFLALERWLEDELRRDDVTQIKAQVRQRKLGNLIRVLERARPPALAEPLAAVRTQWYERLGETADHLSGRVDAAIRPAVRHLEADLSIEHHQQYRGIFGLYVAATDLVRYGPMLLGRRLRGHPEGQADLLSAARGVADGSDVRDLFDRLSIDLRLIAAETLGDAAGSVPARWIDDGLKAVSGRPGELVGGGVHDCLIRMLAPPSAGGVVRAGRALLRGFAEIIPTLFLLWCGWLLAVQFWRGQVVGGGFLIHAAALLTILCVVLQIPVSLLDSTPRLKDHRRLREGIRAALRDRLIEVHTRILDEFARAVDEERRRVAVLIAGLERHIRLVARDRAGELDALFAGAVGRE